MKEKLNLRRNYIMKEFGKGLLRFALIYGGAIGGAMLGKVVLDKVTGTKTEQIEETEYEDVEEIIDVKEDEA